ncbi:hypothetical protein KQI84_13150 [bacterium]|nr:hypothetical protein [bacterium]
MTEPLQVTCPCCKSILVVDRKTGKVLETREPLVEDTSGDRFEDARRLVRETQQRAEEKFKAAQQAQKEKLSKLDALFKERSKEIKESGEPIEKPENPFDRD